MNRVRIVGFVFAGILAFSAAMSAAVSFDPFTGNGFVGKGDVQDAFGWNNAQLQANADGVTFTFESESQYAQSCMKDNARQTIYKDFKKSVEVDAAVSVQARKNPQGMVTGFELLGFGGEVSNASVPDDLCNPGNADPSGWVVDPSGVYPVVTQIGGSSAGGLFVNFNGSSVQLQ
jgi:hypothetical protein